MLDVTDNQVRALRRRDLIERLREGNRAFAAGTLGANEVRPRERMGAYWGIDTDAAKLDPPDALPCSADVTDRLARVATRLSDLGERTSHELVNWGYAICDRSVRANYRGPIAPLAAAAAMAVPGRCTRWQLRRDWRETRSDALRGTHGLRLWRRQAGVTRRRRCS